MKQLYDATKKLLEIYGKPERLIKDEEGNTMKETQEQRNTWTEYFKELLNRPAPLNPPSIEAEHTDLRVDVTPPTIKQIRAFARQIKIGKAAGFDDIPAEALK
ncbi:unnamed protein product [Schistosoma margrebowiei]|uniref:Uncharacterized protein n=1 Tax=Schistosoma margrebowiei TaxID=48269 RepID=A0A183MNI0_9TREM|nr:unnamed protein product [Schistosoma margrebowiei]